MRTTKQLQRFYVVEVFRTQPLIPGSQGSETVSLPYRTSAFDRGQDTTIENRMLIEGASRSIRIRSRFPLHPSLSVTAGKLRCFPSKSFRSGVAVPCKSFKSEFASSNLSAMGGASFE